MGLAHDVVAVGACQEKGGPCDVRGHAHAAEGHGFAQAFLFGKRRSPYFANRASTWSHMGVLMTPGIDIDSLHDEFMGHALRQAANDLSTVVQNGRSRVAEATLNPRFAR